MRKGHKILVAYGRHPDEIFAKSVGIRLGQVDWKGDVLVKEFTWRSCHHDFIRYYAGDLVIDLYDDRGEDPVKWIHMEYKPKGKIPWLSAIFVRNKTSRLDEGVYYHCEIPGFIYSINMHRRPEELEGLDKVLFDFIKSVNIPIVVQGDAYPEKPLKYYSRLRVKFFSAGKDLSEDEACGVMEKLISYFLERFDEIV